MTSKFANKTFTPVTQSSEGGNTGGSNNPVDWKALNEHVAEKVQEAIGCEEGSPSAVIGIISGVVEYGKHQDPERVEPMDEGDAKTQDWKKYQVEKGKATVDADGMFHYQAPACQEVGFFVDFPSIIVDKGQFFGDSNPQPYRVLLGGVFKGIPAQLTKIQGYPNEDKVWVFGDKNRATKLAKAAKLPDLKNGFAQERLLELIGQPIQFSAEVFVNSAGYLQEKVTNPSPLMNGMPVPEIDEDLLFYVGLNEDNEEQYLKYLTKPVKEYQKEALDFEGSKLQKQLEKLEGGSSDNSSTSPKETPKKQEAPAKVDTTPSMPEEDVDGLDFDEIPF